MNAEQCQHFRTFLLGVLVVGAATGVTEGGLLAQARINFSSSLTLPELQSELLMLADKSWVVSFLPMVGDRRWRLTTLGVSIAQELGLA
jgi:hypothetical protein